MLQYTNRKTETCNSFSKHKQRQLFITYICYGSCYKPSKCLSYSFTHVCMRRTQYVEHIWKNVGVQHLVVIVQTGECIMPVQVPKDRSTNVFVCMCVKMKKSVISNLQRLSYLKREVEKTCSMSRNISFDTIL